jgi:hypothetical protein
MAARFECVIHADADRQDDPAAWLVSHGGAPMHDPLALMSVIEPAVLQQVRANNASFAAISC